MPQLSPTAQLTLAASLSNSACRWFINREGSSGLKESNVPWPDQGSAGLLRLAASPGLAASLLPAAGTCRAQLGLTLRTRHLSKAGILCLELAFELSLDTNAYNSWRDG